MASGFWLFVASVAFGFRGFCGFCGFWLSWLLWLLSLLSFWPLHLSVYIYLSFFLSFCLSSFLFRSFAFPFVCFAETKPNKEASKQASTHARTHARKRASEQASERASERASKQASKQASSPLDLVCCWGRRCTPPSPAPRNLHFIPDTRACHEISILR